MDPVTKHRVTEVEQTFRRETAEIVLHYPQYDLEEAQDLDEGDRKLLLHYARLSRYETLQELQAIFVSTDKKSYAKTRKRLADMIKTLTKAL